MQRCLSTYDKQTDDHRSCARGGRVEIDRLAGAAGRRAGQQATQRQVLDVIERLGYERNELASACAPIARA